MVDRAPDEVAHERSALDAAHTQNEAGRDAFTALAHTALFASSVAFVGDVRPINDAVWKPALILGWGASVVGLLALALSFGAAKRAIDAQRAALYEQKAPRPRLALLLNSVSLWSFPVALLCIFSFVTANVVSIDERPRIECSAPAPTPASRSQGSNATTTGARTSSGDRGASGSSGSVSAAATPVSQPRQVACTK